MLLYMHSPNPCIYTTFCTYLSKMLADMARFCAEIDVLACASLAVSAFPRWTGRLAASPRSLPLNLAANDSGGICRGVHVDVGVASLQASSTRGKAPMQVCAAGRRQLHCTACSSLTSNSAMSCSSVDPARGPPMSAAVKLPTKERSPDCGGCSCGSEVVVVVAALPTPTGTRHRMTGPEVVALPCRGGGKKQGEWQQCRRPQPPALATPPHTAPPHTSWMWAIVHFSAFCTLSVQYTRSGWRAAFHVPVVAVLMAGTW